MTHDDVFLEAPQIIDAGHGRGFGEDARGVLEARGAEEAFGLKRGLGNAEQHRLRFGRLAAHLLDTLILFFELDAVDLFAPEEAGVARFGDADLAEHLAHDDFNVLVINRHALEAINFLHFIDEVFLKFLRTAHVEDFMRIDRPFSELLAFLDVIAFEDDDVLADRDEVFLFRVRLRIFDDDAALAADARAEVHDAIDLRNLRGVFRPASLEQFGNTRQTARDVLGLGDLARRLRQQRAGNDLVLFGDDDMRAGRNRIIRHRLIVVVHNHDLRVQIFLVFDNDDGFLAGGLVHLHFHGDAFDHVLEFHFARFLGENRDVVRVPLDERIALLDPALLSNGDDRTDHHIVVFQFATIITEN